MEDECERMRYPREIKEPTLARIANPKTLEFQAVRQSLLPGKYSRSADIPAIFQFIKVLLFFIGQHVTQ